MPRALCIGAAIVIGAVMPMADADKVALRTFLSTRRGERVLQPDIQADMLTYLVAKNPP